MMQPQMMQPQMMQPQMMQPQMMQPQMMQPQMMQPGPPLPVGVPTPPGATGGIGRDEVSNTHAERGMRRVHVCVVWTCG
jgi:hypothetical protein